MDYTIKLKTSIAFALLFFLLAPFPTHAGISVVGKLTQERMSEPGDTYHGSIYIKNAGNEDAKVRVYQTDFLFFFDGTNKYGEPGEDPRSNADWFTLSPKELIVPPGQTSEVSYIVEVPAEESLTGTYWSMVMVQDVQDDNREPGVSEKGKIKVSLSETIRFGIQMITNIGDTGTRKLNFLNTKLLKEKQSIILQIDAENTGQRKLSTLLYAEFYNENGKHTGRFEGGKLGIYPGTSVRFRIDLGKIPTGTYKALVVADCGADALFGANYTLKIK